MGLEADIETPTPLAVSVPNFRTASSLKPLGLYPLEAFESINAALKEISERYGGGALILPAGATPSEPGSIEMLPNTTLTGPAAEFSVAHEHSTAWLSAIAGEAPVINYPTTTYQAAVRSLAIVGHATRRQALVMPRTTNRGGNRFANLEAYNCGAPNVTFEGIIEAGHLTEIKNVSSFAGIEVGAVLRDLAFVIPAGVTVVSFNEGAGTITLSEPAVEAHALQKIEAIRPALFVGQEETRMADFLVFHSTGAGFVLNAADCHMSGSNQIGYSEGGGGLLIGENTGPLTVAGALDVYFAQGIGVEINGTNHRLGKLQTNNNLTNNLVFRRTTGTVIMHYEGFNAGAEGEGLYSDVVFAHPFQGNQGCAILGGVILCNATGAFATKPKHYIEAAEHTASYPSLIGMHFTGKTSTGESANNYVFETTGFNIRGCYAVPDMYAPKNGLAGARFRSVGGVDQVQFYNLGMTGTASGVTAGGAFYDATVAQALKANGKVTINSKECGEAVITLEANATETEITNPTNGQLLTIEYIQDATGNRTYTWPANCHFAGGAAPVASITKAYGDAVTFRYNAAAGQWKERARAIGIH